MRIQDFNFDLPNELIAFYPTKERSQSRLMSVAVNPFHVDHTHFYELPLYLQPGDLLIFNDTKVIPARIKTKKLSGGAVEILLERILDTHLFKAQARASKGLKIGDCVYGPGDVSFKVIAKEERFLIFTVNHYAGHVQDYFINYGEIPLPPYITRQPEKDDQHRYQTIYAQHDGSVAAPTAGFHFDDQLLMRLKEKNINFGFLTLHVGAGTFAPVRVDDLNQHVMHKEYVSITEHLCQQIEETRAAGKRIIAVGTTTLRALESASYEGEIKPFKGDTDIFIRPGYQFQCVDMLITNFHLPQSSLLMLVSAFSGHEDILTAYRFAVENKYRFYSYGDAMLLTRKKDPLQH